METTLSPLYPIAETESCFCLNDEIIRSVAYYRTEGRSLRACEDPRGFGWMLIDAYGNRSPFMTKLQALDILQYG